MLQSKLNDDGLHYIVCSFCVNEFLYLYKSKYTLYIKKHKSYIVFDNESNFKDEHFKVLNLQDTKIAMSFIR